MNTTEIPTNYKLQTWSQISTVVPLRSQSHCWQ